MCWILAAFGASQVVVVSSGLVYSAIVMMARSVSAGSKVVVTPFRRLRTHLSGFDFDALAARRVDPPLVPAISSALDAENFNADACDEDTGVAPFEGDQTIYDDWSEGYVQFPAPGPDA